jgi:hypothetical protein
MQVVSIRNAMRPTEESPKNKVNSKTRPIANPATFTTDNDLVTIEPAISLAFGRLKERNTEKTAGATTAPKNNAEPSHIANNTSLM